MFLYFSYIVVLVLLESVSSVKSTYRVEMKFRAKNDLEKQERLKLLHDHQGFHLNEQEEEEAEILKIKQIQGLISNAHGGHGSFPGVSLEKSSLITAPLSFGGQTFDFCLDTGSSTIWVTSKTCESSTCKTHKRYDATLSTTFQQIQPQIQFSIQYGSGQVSGILAREEISFGNDIVIPSQVFGLTSEEEGSSFVTSGWSGIIGLGYPSLASFEGVDKNLTRKPLFDSLMELKLLNSNGFSFWLVKSEEHVPMFFLGSPPVQYYEGVLEFFPVVEKYYWSINLHDILVDDVSLGLCNQTCKVVVDSGTAYQSAPSDDLRVILTALGGNSGNQACQEKPTKVITYVLDNNKRFTLSPDDYFTKDSENKYCKVKYIGLDVDQPHGPLHIFGDVFFRKYFIHFDRDQDRVGIALAKKNIKKDSSGVNSLQSLLMQKLGLKN